MRYLLLGFLLFGTAFQADAGFKTLACGARVADGMEGKAAREAKNNWALPESSSKQMDRKESVAIRAADSTAQTRHR